MKHKSKAGEESCICDTCPRRFECFTVERVFSDALLQGLFEAMLAEGLSREEALRQVKEEIKYKITAPLPQPYVVPLQPSHPYTTPSPSTWYINPYTWTSTSTYYDSNNITLTDCTDIKDSNTCQITYKMYDGKVYSWNASKSEL